MHTTTSSATASSTTSSGNRATDHTIRYDTWIGYASHLSPKMWKDETGILFAIEEAKIDGDPSCRPEVNETMRAALAVDIHAKRRGAHLMHSPGLGGLRLRGAGSNASSSRTTTPASDAPTAGTSAATTATAPAAAPSRALPRPRRSSEGRRHIATQAAEGDRLRMKARLRTACAYALIWVGVEGREESSLRQTKEPGVATCSR